MRAYREIDDHFEVKIEKGRLVVLGVGAGLTLLLVFLVGVLVGKGLWGAKQDVLVAASAPMSYPPVPQDGEKPQYTFYDDLKRPDSAAPQKVTPRAPGATEPVAETAVPAPNSMEAAGQLPATPKEVSVSAPVVAPTAESSKRPETRAGAEVKSSPAIKPVPDAKKTETAKAAAPSKPADAAKPSATSNPLDGTKTSATDKTGSAAKAPGVKPGETAKPSVEAKLGAPSYTVQVGSYRDRASADNQAKKIAAQGVTPQVVSAPMEGRTWFRVQVGRYETRAEAESYYQKKLRPKGVEGFVTQR